MGIIDSTISKPLLHSTSNSSVLTQTGLQHPGSFLHLNGIGSNNTPTPPNLRSNGSSTITNGSNISTSVAAPFSLLRSGSSSNSLPPPPLLHSLTSALGNGNANGTMQDSTLITVIIKYNDKELKFIYPANTNSPPTILELISNSKQAFGIITNSRVLRIRNQMTGMPINNDFEIERLFQMTGNGGVIRLELVYFNVIQDFLNLNYDSPVTHQGANVISGTSTSSAFIPATITRASTPTSVNSNNTSNGSPFLNVNNANHGSNEKVVLPPITSSLHVGSVTSTSVSQQNQSSQQQSQTQQQQNVRSRLPFMKFQPLL
ncbi:unnamed protein product [Ambrosiozyma monospora]|uniref:Unnamed protein product n=1 Tax=Ambrosiozyma monospora TaxID=43982 RepID=A0ACB5T7J4_AMBMO|nr:unnamed protein product [Ambrosiozyma monospora]